MFADHHSENGVIGSNNTYFACGHVIDMPVVLGLVYLANSVYNLDSVPDRSSINMSERYPKDSSSPHNFPNACHQILGSRNDPQVADKQSDITPCKINTASVNRSSSTQAKHSLSISLYSSWRTFPSGNADEVPSPTITPACSAASATSMAVRGDGSRSHMKNPPPINTSLSCGVGSKVRPRGTRCCFIA